MNTGPKNHHLINKESKELITITAEKHDTVESDGEYGIEDVCLSGLAIVGKEGVSGHLKVPLTNEEVALFQKSANALKDVINQLKF